MTDTDLTAILDEDPETSAARAAQPGAPAAEIGALLAVLASSARSVVEVGSAGGVTGRWLLRGMPDRGILTSLEPQRDVHDRTSVALATAAADGRARPIQGDAATVLGRLADDGYQLVLLQTPPATLADLLAESFRVLAPGGVLIARRVLADDTVDQTTFLSEVRDAATSFTLLPIDDGLLVAKI